MKKVNLVWQILFLSIFCTLFRVPLLGNSFWLDEAAQALESSRPFSDQLKISQDFQPPLYHLLVHVLSYFSQTEWWLRLISLSASIISLISCVYIAKHLNLSKASILLFGVLMSTNSFAIFYAQELRPYTLSMMFATLSWLSLLHVVRKPNQSRSALIVYTLFSICGLYSMYLYPFLFISQFLYVLFVHRHLLIRFTISGVFSAIAFLPWLPFFVQQLQTSQVLRQGTPNWEEVVGTPFLKSLPLVPLKFILGVKPVDLSILDLSGVGLFAAFIFVSTLIYLKKSVSTQLKQTITLLLYWFVVPLLSSWITSLFIPILQPKRVIFLLPAFYLLVASGYQLIATQKVYQRIAICFATALLVLNLSITFLYWSDPKLQREDWRTLIRILDQQYEPTNTIIVFGFDGPFAPWEWYIHQPFEYVATGTKTVTNKAEIAVQMNRVLNFHQVIVFDYLRDLTDPNDRIGSWLKEYGYVESRVIDQPNIGFVRVYTKGGIFAGK